MVTRRNVVLALGAGVLGAPIASIAANAQTYPTRPVRILVGFPKGGPVDIAARLVAPWLSERLGQPFSVENHPGQSGNVATGEGLKAPADGYTLLLCGPVNTINTTLYPDLDFNFTRDSVPIAGISRVPLVVEVNPAFNVRSVPEFLAYAKAHPGEIRVAYAGKGTPQHIGIEMFRMMAGVDLSLVPYLGSTPALADLLAGKVQMMFDPIPSSMEHIRNRRLIPLAVTSKRPLESLPDVPAMSRYVPGYEAESWFGLVAPRGTPASVVRILNREVNAALADPKIRQSLADMGAQAFAGTPASFGRFMDRETVKYRKVITDARITL
jgi:tripartite-type tricarboxylate transporter receptor subunit TctC